MLVGDTPNDLRAGLDGGAKIIAVASGSDSADVLANAGADLVLSSLADTAAFLTAIEQTLGV
ncbi:HAD family hydrolase [Nocardia sp. NPDC052278]|uniref:HAD family hydrolase n=1 Tax=unclassified Nocardia TaxID=2637762 RepID=UPI0036B8D654